LSYAAVCGARRPGAGGCAKYVRKSAGLPRTRLPGCICGRAMASGGGVGSGGFEDSALGFVLMPGHALGVHAHEHIYGVACPFGDCRECTQVCSRLTVWGRGSPPSCPTAAGERLSIVDLVAHISRH
jgi:hypothetical protein